MIAGVFDEFLGVPTHPLAVHAPVVLIPLLAVVSVAVLFRATWREAASVPLAGLSLVMVAMLFVAKESGESLLDSDSVFLNGSQAMISDHQDLGNQTFVIGIVWSLFAIAAAAASIVGRRHAATSLSSAAGDAVSTRQVLLVLNVLAAVALVVTTIWLIRTGHAGSESRWTI